MGECTYYTLTHTHTHACVRALPVSECKESLNRTFKLDYDFLFYPMPAPEHHHLAAMSIKWMRRSSSNVVVAYVHIALVIPHTPEQSHPLIILSASLVVLPPLKSHHSQSGSELVRFIAFGAVAIVDYGNHPRKRTFNEIDRKLSLGDLRPNRNQFDARFAFYARFVLQIQ